jgi:hypothetical protein
MTMIAAAAAMTSAAAAVATSAAVTAAAASASASASASSSSSSAAVHRATEDPTQLWHHLIEVPVTNPGEDKYAQSHIEPSHPAAPDPGKGAHRDAHCVGKEELVDARCEGSDYEAGCGRHPLDVVGIRQGVLVHAARKPQWRVLEKDGEPVATHTAKYSAERQAAANAAPGCLATSLAQERVRWRFCA